jgi:23S rRNA pseudouridine2604 synthase
MFFEIGYEVKRLVRTRIGNIRLGDLPRGHWRALTKTELRSLEPRYSTPARKTSSGDVLPTP